MSPSLLTSPSPEGVAPPLPPDAGLHHVAGHQLQPLLQMLSELVLGPVEVAHEHLEGVQLPEQVLRGARPVAVGDRARQCCWGPEGAEPLSRSTRRWERTGAPQVSSGGAWGVRLKGCYLNEGRRGTAPPPHQAN